jgi:acyl dehydratase
VVATFDASAHSQSMIGVGYRAEDHYEVGREKIREYARAVQDYHPAHWHETAASELDFDGLVAPTTFMSIAAMAANRKLLETIIVGYDAFVQTDQIFEMYKPIVAGDQLTSDVELTSVRHIAGKDLLTVKNTFTDRTNQVAQVMYTTVAGLTADDVDEGISDAIRGVIMHGFDMPPRVPAEGWNSADAEHPGVPPSPSGTLSPAGRTRVPHTAIRFEDITVGDELPPRTVKITRGDLVNYAGVSGDANPIHWHEQVAVRIGLPDVIAHGMLTMGLGAGFVTTWLDDPAAVIRYGARLANYAVIEAQSAGKIEFTGAIKSIDPHTRSAVVRIVARSAGRKIFGLATADIRLA